MNLRKTLRIIFRNKTYGILNVLGLAVGITSAALIFLWVEHMVSFNKAIPNIENIYRVGQNQFYGDNIYTFHVSPGPFAETVERVFPTIRRTVRIQDNNYTFASENGQDAFREQGCYADSTLFSIADMKFIRGNAQTAFNGGFPIVISEEMAGKFFGNEDPVGERLQVEDRYYEITGVFSKMHENTSFQYQWVIPFRVLVDDYNKMGWDTKGWRNNWHRAFVETEPSADINAINERLKVLISENIPGNKTELFIYPAVKTRLYGEFRDGKETGSGYIRTVRLFFIIGVIILLIACINFMNLSTARSQSRAMEVGIRKTFGTRRGILVRQFLYESGMITFLSLLVAVGLVYLCLPEFNKLVSQKLWIDWANPVVPAGLASIWLFCTVLAGSYPAFLLSSFSPVSTLKKQTTGGRTGSVIWIRQGLVVFQFAIALVLISSTLAVFKQIEFGRNRDIGLNKENLVVYQAPPEIQKSFAAVVNELKNTGLVEHAGLCSQLLITINNNGGGYEWKGKNPEENPLISQLQISPGLIDAAGIKFVDGKDFLPHQEKGNYVIINETLAEMMGDEGHVGGKIGRSSDPADHSEIVGIVKDIIFNDIYREKSDPIVMYPYPEVAENLFVRLKPDSNTAEALATVKSVLQSFLPDEPFDPVYMEQYFDNMFSSTKLEGKLAALFAALAIFISCLGLFGLSSFSAEQRTREIGIRKVLGASALSAVILLGKSYMKLILIAFAIGIPVAVYINSKYLSEYSYRITLGWTFYAAVALLVILIAICTVSFQSLKAAMANPVKSIKTE